VYAIKPPGVRLEGLSRQAVSLSSDTLALAAGASVRCFETAQGRPVGDALVHGADVAAVCLSQAGTAADRLLAVLDSNGDLFLARPLDSSSAGTQLAAARSAAAAGATKPNSSSSSSAVADGGVVTADGLVAAGGTQQLLQQQQRRLVKLAAAVSGVPVWHDSAPMLAALVDGQLVVWACPAAAFGDRDLLKAARITISLADRCVFVGRCV
jgi:hypothetical protein